MNLELLLKEALDHHLAKKDGKTPRNLEESIRYSLLAPGKRIRPRLLLTCAEMVGLPVSAVVPAALSLEMIHCFTLIHDDLPCMDDDDFRRGLPSNHKKFGEATALLAGDGLLALAIEVFLDCSVDTPNLLAGLKRLLWAAGPRGVIGGQAAESLLGSHSRLEDLEEMHAKKTGALFSAALLIPKDFAQISDSSRSGEVILSFSHELGLAFQMADDLEDLSDDSKRRKPAQPTSVLYFLSAEEASRRTIRRLTEASESLLQEWGPQGAGLKQIAEEVIGKIKSALESS